MNMKPKQRILLFLSVTLIVLLALSALTGCGKTEIQITFDPANGSEATVVTVEKGSLPQLPADPVREGYVFAGWYLGDAKFDASTALTESVTLVARWTAKTYTVTFDTAGGSTATPATVAHGGTVTAPEGIEREGYDLVGWYLGETAYDFTAPVTGDITLVARWEIHTYTVTFDTAGGNMATPATVAHGGTVTAPEGIEREGYDFVGWYLGETAYDFTTPVTGNLSLVARWQVKTFTVTFFNADGSLLKTETVEWGGAATAPVPPAGTETTIFAGWDKAFDHVTENLTVTATYAQKMTVTFKNEADETLTTVYVPKGHAVTAPTLTPPEEKYELDGYYLGSVSYDFSAPVTTNLILTVKWKIKSFTVTLDPANGSSLISETHLWGEKVTVPEQPTRVGYDFAGWYLGETAYDFDAEVKANLSIVARWQIKTYTVTFDTAGGSTAAPVTVEHGGTVSAPEGVVYDGYHIVAWYLNGTAYDFTTPVTGEITLVAQWEINTYTVTFDAMGGDARDPQTVNWNTTATKPEDPTRQYYRFGGWYLNGTAYDFTTPVTGDITLKAEWIIINYTVTFDSNGGTSVPDVLANAGKPVTKPTNPTKTGYRFGGWLTEDNKIWNFDTLITGDITLTAQWFSKTEAPAPTMTDIYLDPGTIEMWEGMSLKLAMAPTAVSDKDGAFTKLTAAGITMRFEALDPDVATVTADGTVTSVSIGETLVYAVYETGGTINNGTADVTVTAGDISNAVTVRVVDKPDYLKVYEADTENQKITLGDTKGKDFSKYGSYPTGNYGAANIAAWYGNAGAVFTMTADDNLMNDFAQWLAWYDAYGVVTTLCAPTRTPYECTDLWNEMINKGLAVQSHSHFHRSAAIYSSGVTSSAQDWMDFYQGQKDIEASGIRSLAVAYPCGYNNSELSSLLYIAGRGTGGYLNSFNLNYNETGSFSGLSAANWAKLLEIAQNGNGEWMSTHYHQIGSAATTITENLALVAPYISSGKLWSTSFAAAAQYGQERDTATLTMGTLGKDTITFTLTDKMNDLLFDHALTVKIKVDSTWTGVRAYQNGQEMPARVVTDSGETYLFVDAIPDRGEVTVVRTELSGLTSGTGNITFTPVNAGDAYGMTEMTRRFYVTGDEWANVYAVQGGKRIAAIPGNVGGSRYVDVTFNVGAGEVSVVPTTTQFDAQDTYTMTDVYWGAVTPVSGKPITISTAEELQFLARYVNNDNSCEGLTFVLTDDIDLKGVEMDSIGWYVQCNKSSGLLFDRSFSGTFDGQGHTVSNLSIHHNGCSTGFFGSVDGGTVKNVKLVNATIFGMRQTGGLVGRLNAGTVNNCSFSGTVSSRGIGAGQNSGINVGGLVGDLSGSVIRNCAVEAEILVFGAYNRGEDSYADIYVNSNRPYNNGSSVGGVIGKAGGATSTVQNVNFKGKVTAVTDRGDNADSVGGFIGGGTYATVIDCSATAEVSGNQKVGGFIGSHEGFNQVLSIRNCIANGSVYGNDYVGGFAGYMGYTGRASTSNSLANVRVSAKEGAAWIGAVVGQAQANQQSPSAKNVYYIPSLNPGMASHTPLDGTVKVTLTFNEVADTATAMETLNALATAASDQTWIASGDTITPVHYPIFRVVFLDKDGGELAAYDVPNGMGVTAPDAPTYLGYRFTGWSAETASVTEDMTVTAQYETIATHTVIFKDKDGNEISRTTVNDGDGVTPPAAPTYEGYRFTGWSAETASVTEDMTVTAQYEVVVIWTVTFVERDGVTPIGAAQLVNDGDGATAPDAPAVDGYVFTGWSIAFTEVHENLTVVAQYAKLYTVRFYGYENVLLATISVQDGTAATAPKPPTVDGYRFAGWVEDFSNVTSDLDVHATYKVKSTDPITVEIKQMTSGRGFSQARYEQLLSGGIVFLDGTTVSTLSAATAAGWGHVAERAMQGTNAGGGHAITFNLSRYELASGMSPLSLVSTDVWNNAPPILENYKVVSFFGNNTQVLAVPLLDKTSNRIFVAVAIYQGQWGKTAGTNLTTLFQTVFTLLAEEYPEADAFVGSYHCSVNEKGGGNAGLTARVSALDDGNAFVDGWDLNCISEVTGQNSTTYYTLTYTQTGETGTVTVPAATVADVTNTNACATATVQVAKKQD